MIIPDSAPAEVKAAQAAVAEAAQAEKAARLALEQAKVEYDQRDDLAAQAIIDGKKSPVPAIEKRYSDADHGHRAAVIVHQRAQDALPGVIAQAKADGWLEAQGKAAEAAEQKVLEAAEPFYELVSEAMRQREDYRWVKRGEIEKNNWFKWPDPSPALVEQQLGPIVDRLLGISDRANAAERAEISRKGAEKRAQEAALAEEREKRRAEARARKAAWEAQQPKRTARAWSATVRQY